MKNILGFTPLSTSNRCTISEIKKVLFIICFLPNRSLLPAKNSSSNFLPASQKFQHRKGTLKIPLWLSGRKPVAYSHIWNNRYLRMTLIWIPLSSLYFDLFPSLILTSEEKGLFLNLPLSNVNVRVAQGDIPELFLGSLKKYLIFQSSDISYNWQTHLGKVSVWWGRGEHLLHRRYFHEHGKALLQAAPQLLQK